jgi:hypothetical protein
MNHKENLNGYQACSWLVAFEVPTIIGTLSFDNNIWFQADIKGKEAIIDSIIIFV